MPTNDSGLTARDIVETGDREADLAIQADKLAVRELIAEIEREQLATLQRILDAQTSFGGQGLTGNGLRAWRAVAAIQPVPSKRSMASADIDPNPGGAQMFGDAAENIEQLIIRVAQETSGFAGVGPRRPLAWFNGARFFRRSSGRKAASPSAPARPSAPSASPRSCPGTASDLGINPEYYDSPYLQVHGGARYLATQLNTFDGNIINALAAYNAGPGRVFEYGGRAALPQRPSTTSRSSPNATISI